MQFQLVSSTAAPVASPVNLTAFVRSDLSFDISAIRAASKTAYALKLDFINRYTGSAKRHWQLAQARRAITATWSEAREQHHKIVWNRLPRELPFTTAEIERLAVLKGIMASASVTARGNADYKAAAAEYGTIGKAAQMRAYQAIIAAARSAA